MFSDRIDDAIYDAGLNDEAMRALGDLLSAELDAQGCWVQRVHPANGEMLTASGFDIVADNDIYMERFYSIDPWLAKGMSLGADQAHSLDKHIVLGGFLSGEFYNEYLRPRSDYAHCMGAHFTFDGQPYAISLQRTREAGAFSPESEARLDRMLPHLKRALTTHWRLRDQADQIARLELALEAEPLTMLIDRGFGLFWSNRPVDADSDWPFRLTAVGGRQRLSSTTAIGRAIREATAGGAAQSNIVRAGRWVVEVDPALDPPSGRPMALVRLRDTEGEATRRVRRAGGHFGLTASEERLCASLMRGLSLQDHADLAGTMISTVRSHLKGLMAKMGVSRQAEVVAVLAEMGR
jgi:DNA-binding CsgD family transcriptional regulator